MREVLPSLTNTDSAGNINRTQDLLTNLEHRVTYDFTCRLISKEVLNLSASGDRWHRSLEYDYDLNNNVSRFAYADRNGSSFTEYEYGLDNLLEKTTLQNGKEVTYNYDAFGRLTSKSLNTSTPLNYAYTYMQSQRGSGFTTTKIECETIGDITYKYTYDEYGNITTIKKVNADNTETTLYIYVYDEYNQLQSVNDKITNTFTSYTYDESGNILNITTKNCTGDDNATDNDTIISSINYLYNDSEWKDLLTSYNGQTITYDSIGNPLNYRDDITLTWQNVRELATYSDDNYDVTYTYDASSMRTGKSVTNSAGTTNTYTYVYENGQLLQMCMGSRIYDFSYDANGTPVSVAYRTRATATPTYYYYAVNSRGDITALYNGSGSIVAVYEYDAYGKLISVENATGVAITSATHIANMNPLRYRGYVYDNETGFYYLQSRYYDPTTCRFINEDIYYDTGRGFNGYNMFAYCNNNPIMSYDPTGTREPVGGGPIRAETANERYLSCKRQREISLIATDSNSFIGIATTVSNEFEHASLHTLFWGSESGLCSTKLLSGDFDQPVTFFVQQETDWWNLSERQVGINVHRNDYGATYSISSFGVCRGWEYKDTSIEYQLGVDKIGITIYSGFDHSTHSAGSYYHMYIRPWTVVPAVVATCYTFGLAGSLFIFPQLQPNY